MSSPGDIFHGMEQNPYESPQEPAGEPSPEILPAEGTTSEAPRRMVRRGVPLVVAVAWNVPLAAILVFAFSGRISERTMERALLGCTLAIPLSCLALLYVPWLRRLVFVPEVTLKELRPKLWSLAALWLVIFGVWLVAEVIRG
jgi:hypothetical protein